MTWGGPLPETPWPLIVRAESSGDKAGLEKDVGAAAPRPDPDDEGVVQDMFATNYTSMASATSETLRTIMRSFSN